MSSKCVRRCVVCVCLACGALADGVVCGQVTHTESWRRQFGGVTYDNIYDLVADSHGSYIAAGYTESDLAGTNAGYSDAFVTKYDPAGVVMWTAQFGTERSDRAHAVGVDHFNNIYVTGETFGALAESPGENADVFLAKLDPSGQRLWIRQFGTADSEGGRSVAVSDAGDVFVASLGRDRDAIGRLIDRPTVSKFDSDGNRDWTVDVPGLGRSVNFLDIAADSAGDIYFVATTIDPNGSSGDLRRTAIVGRMSSEGQFAWSQSVGIATEPSISSIAVDGLDRVYVAGTANDDGVYAPRPFLAQISSEGDVAWLREVESLGDAYGSDVTIDAAGDAYLTGFTNDAVTFAPHQTFLSRFNAVGGEEWTDVINTDSSIVAVAAAADPSGGLALAGYTNDSFASANAGDSDGFMVRVAPVPEPGAAILALMAAASFAFRRITRSRAGCGVPPAGRG